MVLGTYVVAGALAGLGILHPITMAVYWYEFHPEHRALSHAWRFILDRLRVGFTPEMLPMVAVFLVIGGGLGLAFGTLSRALARRQRVVDFLERELRWDLYSLISHGESELVEFKSSLRWDGRENRVARALEGVIARSIAGLMNQRGGSLIIGVDDDGNPLGLEADYATLHPPNRDGFERCLRGIVETYLDADACPLVHVLFHDVGHQDVCRVLIEPALCPVYFVEDGTPHYLLRTGKSTRELDERETMRHLSTRWPRQGTLTA